MQYVVHSPHDEHLWVGRQEKFESERACYWHQRVTSDKNTTAPIAIVGFCSDQGVLRNQGRIGAKHAPDKIKSALAKLPIGGELLNRYPHAPLLIDYGNIHCVDDDKLTLDALENAQQIYAQSIGEMLAMGKLPIGLGGGHEIAYGSFLGLWQYYQTQSVIPKIGIINLDAHLDIRQNDIASSGTPFRQISEMVGVDNFYYLCVGVSKFGNTAALFDRAEQLGVQMIFDDECHRLSFKEIETRLLAFCQQVDILYLTIDMDSFAAEIIPAVSAPATKGFGVDFAERCLEIIMGAGKVKLVDIAEINPNYDIDNKSIKVTARLLALLMERYLLKTNAQS